MTPPVDSTADLRVLFRSRHPLLVVEAADEGRLLTLVRRVAAEASLPVWTWTAARGLARDGMGPQYRTADPRAALAFVGDLTAPGVFVFCDAQVLCADPVALRAVKDAAGAADPGQTIVLAGPGLAVPPELKGVALPWSLRPPSDEELAALVHDLVDHLARRGLTESPGREVESGLVEALRGLSLSDAQHLLQRTMMQNGGLSEADLPRVRAAKMELLDSDGVLELIPAASGTLDRVAGLAGLKAWLRLRGSAVGSQRAREMGLDPPRGVLLTGVPGCGKSLVAKTLAATWGRPLLLLDPARLFRKYVGESEQRLEAALRTAEAMAPAVLWIDEIEKGFAAGGGADGGVSTRLLGTFLRWMQDRPDGVFLVATANDVSALPPEFLRKGRFDEVFFVDLPDAGARRAVLSVQLSARGHDPARFDLPRMAAATEGFSGAEIEAVVVGALYRAFAASADLATDDLAAEAASVVPLSVARAEEVAALRAWAKERAVPAD
ncbi:MAG: AAA family ATPase [Actinobacteria bacterium]|nr:AAA family ATPase [Actinomycetota bacterium]